SAKHFELIDEPLYFYYQNPNSTVHVINRVKCENRMEAARLLVKESKERGFLDQYHDEIEFRFTELFYGTTLFSYLSGIQGEGFWKQCLFVKKLRDEMKETFPEFQKNSYYQDHMGQEEKELIALQMKSNLLFYLRYRLVRMVRNTRKHG
ncbi:MAG: glycosyl transferase family 2, partial [Lachnospiraceae bacterium]|nr:glycosyl transferase family 2 [Lachnospiraceae bacterium]